MTDRPLLADEFRDGFDEALERVGKRRADLARALGLETSNIAQLLRPGRGLTFDSAQRLTEAAGLRIRMEFEAVEPGPELTERHRAIGRGTYQPE